MKILIADKLFDGWDFSGSKAMAVVMDERIREVLPAAEAMDKYPEVETTYFPGCTILPGLVNCHSHLVMPGDGTRIEEAMDTGNDMLLLRAARNASRALRAGVTTLADLGGRDDVTFALRDAIEEGEFEGPRLILAGRAITSPRGHCWQFNGEVQSHAEMAGEIDRLLERGANIIKIMANGGGTRGTDPYTPQFDDAMLSLAVEKAHAADLPAFAHCSCTGVVRMAVRAGFDVVVHGNLNAARDVPDFDEDLVMEAARNGVRWNPTLEVNRSGIEASEDEGQDPDAIKQRWGAYAYRIDEIARLKDLGIVMLAGSDEGWGSNAFGRFSRELREMGEANHSPLEVLRSATFYAAESLRTPDVGSLDRGKHADILVVEGDPQATIRAVGDVRAVYRGGSRIEIDN